MLKSRGLLAAFARLNGSCCDAVPYVESDISQGVERNEYGDDHQAEDKSVLDNRGARPVLQQLGHDVLACHEYFPLELQGIAL